jgi:transposase-like protein
MSMKNAQQYWSKHIAAIRSEGISVSAYARQHDLALATLYYWQRRLRLATTVRATSVPTQALRGPSKFIALTVGDPIHNVTHSQTPCTLILAGGMRLEMATLPDPQWLSAVGRSAQGAY